MLAFRFGSRACFRRTGNVFLGRWSCWFARHVRRLSLCLFSRLVLVAVFLCSPGRFSFRTGACMH